MTGRATCVSQGRREGQKFILQRSTTYRELSRDTLLWFSMMCLWTLSEAASDMCSILMACGKIEAWQSMSTMCFDFWLDLSPFSLPDSLTRDHSTKHSRSCYTSRQTKEIISQWWNVFYLTEYNNRFSWMSPLGREQSQSPESSYSRE